jgi:hypothetical protein
MPNEDREKWGLAPADYKRLEPALRRELLRLQHWAREVGWHKMADVAAWRLDFETAKACGKYHA